MGAAKMWTGAKYFHLFLNFFILLLLFLEGWERMTCVSPRLVFISFKHTERLLFTQSQTKELSTYCNP